MQIKTRGADMINIRHKRSSIKQYKKNKGVLKISVMPSDLIAGTDFFVATILVYPRCDIW